MNRILSILIAFVCLSCKAGVDSLAKSSYAVPPEKLKKVISADNTIQIDPSFPYYQNRSVESIADELVLAGFKAVHYFVVNENNVNGPLIKALRDRGLPVWLLTLGNGTYSTDKYPAGWEDWKMGLNGSVNGSAGFTFLSPFSKAFVQWKKESLVKLMTRYPFDGIELAESYFPEWDAIPKGTYGDVGPLAKKAFKEQYGRDMPDFSDPNAPNYYKKQPEVYKQWVDFRVKAVNGFLHELINGKGGIREARPDALVATWSLAIDEGPGSFQKLREDQGLDAASMISLVKPDVHFFQTHWPDWVKPESQLPPDYMKNYKAFVDQVRKIHPKVPIGLQADIGSGRQMIKSSGWVKQFNDEAKKHGYVTWTSYEYHLGGYIYHDKPVPKKAVRNSKESVTVSFNKRIDASSAADKSHYSFTVDGKEVDVIVSKVTVDGNRLILESQEFPGNEFEIKITGIKDTPGLWLYKDYPANEVPADASVTVKIL